MIHCPFFYRKPSGYLNLTILIEIAAFSKCIICLHPHVSQMEHFSNGAILKSNISQMEHFSNGAILKSNISQMGQFSNGAFWGRHHQLDDSLVGQLTSFFGGGEGGLPYLENIMTGNPTFHYKSFSRVHTRSYQLHLKSFCCL